MSRLKGNQFIQHRDSGLVCQQPDLLFKFLVEDMDVHVIEVAHVELFDQVLFSNSLYYCRGTLLLKAIEDFLNACWSPLLGEGRLVED